MVKKEMTFERIRPRAGHEDVDGLLRTVVNLGASDLHMKSGHKVRIRIGGKLQTLSEKPPLPSDFEEKLFAFLTENEREVLCANGAVDFAYELDHETRFRVNVYVQESGISVAARIVPRKIPGFSELHLPQAVAELSNLKQGLVIVSGMTGCGKSTTIAAILERINATREEHIVTIEDPIEFLFRSRKSLVNQRELGINVSNYAAGLRSLWREDPDVILIGEMRDADTFRSALEAADTGHLVFSTIHAANAAQTITRILSLFPKEERSLIRQSLVFNLKAIVCQKLVPSILPGTHRIPAVEFMMTTPPVRMLLEEGRDTEIPQVMMNGDKGMQTMTQHMVKMVRQKQISEDTGRLMSPNPGEFRRTLTGFESHTRRVLGRRGA